MSDDLHPLVEVADEATARPVPLLVAEQAEQEPPNLAEALGGLARSGAAYWLVNLVNFTDGIAYFGILNLLVLYFSQDLHIADQYASIYVTMMTGMVALLMVPGGAVSDRIGTRNAISVSLALGTLGRGGLWACAKVPGQALTFCIIGSLSLMAISTGILQPALYAGVKETTRKRLASMGFSLLYELNYTGVLEVLDLAGLPFYSHERDGSHPLIIAGGPCVCNPEPMAPFFDAMLMGDGEEQLLDLCRLVQAWKKEGGGDRRVLLKKLAELDGVYVPAFFTPSWDETGVQHLTPEKGQAAAIVKAGIPTFAYKGETLYESLMQLDGGSDPFCTDHAACLVYRAKLFPVIFILIIESDFINSICKISYNT